MEPARRGTRFTGNPMYVICFIGASFANLSTRLLDRKKTFCFELY